ncbi:hypothetical protein [Amphritea sp.]|uniref:hypothetical protein n=1 Tax=Amphritea sp. TaxID=1872502 RepID=UPI003A908795
MPLRIEDGNIGEQNNTPVLNEGYLFSNPISSYCSDYEKKHKYLIEMKIIQRTNFEVNLVK